MRARLVTHESPEGFLRGVRLLDQRARREMDWAEAAGSPKHWGEAWLWTELDPPPTWASSSTFGGYATFVGYGASWTLLRVWLRPTSRRHGLLGEAWPVWRERYGGFGVSYPSDAMQAFLRRAGYEPGPPVVEGARPAAWVPTQIPTQEPAKTAS